MNQHKFKLDKIIKKRISSSIFFGLIWKVKEKEYLVLWKKKKGREKR